MVEIKELRGESRRLAAVDVVGVDVTRRPWTFGGWGVTDVSREVGVVQAAETAGVGRGAGRGHVPAALRLQVARLPTECSVGG